MTSKEKILYHQIHPLKIAVDVTTGFMTTVFAWQHNIAWFLVLFLIPSVIVTSLLIEFADLARLQNSRFGKYVSRYMTSTVVVIRSAGQILIWIAAWFHLPILIAFGILLIVGAWLNGVLYERKIPG